MSEDRRGVVGTAGPVADRQQSLAEVLDREVLPCLERPGRLLGPFDLPSATVTGETKLALVWPSISEGAHAPEALQRLFVALPNPRSFSLSLGSVPSPNLRAALRERGLPLFGRPDWDRLDAMDLWVVWIDHPLQITGLLTILDDAALPLRAVGRDRGPRVVVAGPAVPRIAGLARVYADAVWTGIDALDGDAWEALARAATSADWRAVLRAHAPVLDPVEAEGSPPPAGERGEPDLQPIRREVDLRADLVTGPGFLRRSCWRERGRAEAFTDHVVIGAGSEALRSRHGLRPTTDILHDIERSLGLETASLTLHFVTGLEAETEADRLSIADFVSFVVAAAPRGARQVRVVLHELSGADPAKSLGPECAGRVDRILERITPRRVRVDAPLPCLSAIETVLGRGSEAATVLERAWSAGALDAMASVVADPALWCAAGEGGEEARDQTAVEPVSTGLPRSMRVEAPASVSPKARSVRGAKARPNRWVRWQSLVPRHFDYRLEYSKTGRLRFLSPTELGDLLLGACERAGVPLCTTGVVQPRPRVGFGPSLGAGIVGDREYIDLSLARKVEGLADLLSTELPEEIRLLAVEFMPRCSPSMQLSRIAFAEYEAELDATVYRLPADRETDEARVRKWSLRIEEGLLPEGDAPQDSLSQLHRITWNRSADRIRIGFTLDLRTESARCKPRDVLSRALASIPVDPRLIPLRRLRLLVVDETTGRARLRTPLEQARLARQGQRSLERLRAE